MYRCRGGRVEGPYGTVYEGPVDCRRWGEAARVLSERYPGEPRPPGSVWPARTILWRCPRGICEEVVVGLCRAGGVEAGVYARVYPAEAAPVADARVPWVKTGDPGDGELRDALLANPPPPDWVDAAEGVLRSLLLEVWATVDPIFAKRRWGVEPRSRPPWLHLCDG